MPKEKYLNKKNISTMVDEWFEVLLPYLRYPFGKPVAERTALLLVDVQRCFFESEFKEYIPSSRAILPNIIKLARNCSEHNVKIILTRYAVKKDEEDTIMKKFWGDDIYDDTPESEIIPELADFESIVITKNTYDAFYNTDLEKIFKLYNTQWVVISGVMTDICCSTTARSAFIRGYMPVIIADATATTTEQLHISALMSLAHGVAEITKTKNFISSFL
ncbi:cysteine hydrolase [bacterium]|nr:cysteine hydrolase [bacterium]